MLKDFSTKDKIITKTKDTTKTEDKDKTKDLLDKINKRIDAINK